MRSAGRSRPSRPWASPAHCRCNDNTQGLPANDNRSVAKPGPLGPAAMLQHMFTSALHALLHKLRSLHRHFMPWN